MKDSLGNEGFIRTTKLFVILVVLLIAVPFVQPYHRYVSLMLHTSDTVKMNVGKSAVIRREILSYAEQKGIPLQNENLHITQERKRIMVDLTWVDEVDHYGYHTTPLTFTINEKY